MVSFIQSTLKSGSIAVASSMLIVGVTSFATSASAAVLGCPASIANSVSGAFSCQYSNTATQDSVSPNKPLTVNQESFFGITNWSFGGKVGENAGYTGSGSGQSGTWNLSSIFQSSWSDVMLVFKSGKNTTLVGYLLQPNVTAGIWDSPFKNSVFNVPNTRDVSHISVYYREGSRSNTNNNTAVPEPTTMAGLALAGAGMAAYRHKRKSSIKA